MKKKKKVDDTVMIVYVGRTENLSVEDRLGITLKKGVVYKAKPIVWEYFKGNQRLMKVIKIEGFDDGKVLDMKPYPKVKG